MDGRKGIKAPVSLGKNPRKKSRDPINEGLEIIERVKAALIEEFGEERARTVDWEEAAPVIERVLRTKAP